MARMTDTVKLGDRGAAALALQHDVNHVLSSRRPSAKIDADGEWGPRSKEACRIAAHLLGVLDPNGNVSRAQAVVRGARRTPAELLRAKRRMAVERKAQTSASRGPKAAIAFLARYVGKTESPAGSNKAPWGLTDWQRELANGASYLVGAAWCGTAVGIALKRAGVKGITSRCASVWFILEDALAGRNGFAKCVYRRKTGLGSVGAGKPGDAVGLYGEGTHVGLIEKRVAGGYQTLEGNTSSGASGSQSNGGGLYRRFRPDSAVVYIARPNWS